MYNLILTIYFSEKDYGTFSVNLECIYTLWPRNLSIYTREINKPANIYKLFPLFTWHFSRWMPKIMHNKEIYICNVFFYTYIPVINFIVIFLHRSNWWLLFGIPNFQYYHPCLAYGAVIKQNKDYLNPSTVKP